MDDHIIDYGDFPAGSPVTEIGRWCEDQVQNFPPAEGRHSVVIERKESGTYEVTFEYPYTNIMILVDEVNGIPDMEPDGVPKAGTCTEVEFIEATRTVLTIDDFEKHK